VDHTAGRYSDYLGHKTCRRTQTAGWLRECRDETCKRRGMTQRPSCWTSLTAPTSVHNITTPEEMRDL
jgi:hypothetical protein